MGKKIRSKNDIIFDTFNYIFLFIILTIVILPLMHVVAASFSDPRLVIDGKVSFIPKGFNLEAYKNVFKHKDLMSGYKNTLIYVLVGTTINVLLTICGAYPLSRKDFKGRNFFTLIFAFTMFFGGGLIPTYLVVQKLNLLNSMWSLILPSAVSMYNMIIMRTFFQSNIPDELHESAILDGCTNIQILLKIVLPLSKAIIAVTALFYLVGNWNSYFSALIYLSDRDKFPLQLILREVLVMNEATSKFDIMENQAINDQVMLAEAIKYAVIIVANLPVLIMYPFLQKYFVKGVMIGAIKG